MIDKDKDYYKILGVDFTSCSDEIKRAYIDLSIKYAPISNLWAKKPMGMLKRAYVRFSIKHAQNLIFWDKTITGRVRRAYVKIANKCAYIRNLVDVSAMDKYEEILEAYNVLKLQPVEPDLYKRLGVERTASADEIKRAYKKYAIKFHPVGHPDTYPQTKHSIYWYKEAPKKLEELSEAYDILHDPEKRRRYDKYGANADFSDIHSVHDNNDVAQLLTLFPSYFGKDKNHLSKISIHNYSRIESIGGLYNSVNGDELKDEQNPSVC